MHLFIYKKCAFFIHEKRKIYLTFSEKKNKDRERMAKTNGYFIKYIKITFGKSQQNRSYIYINNYTEIYTTHMTMKVIIV